MPSLQQPPTTASTGGKRQQAQEEMEKAATTPRVNGANTHKHDSSSSSSSNNNISNKHETEARPSATNGNTKLQQLHKPSRRAANNAHATLQRTITHAAKPLPLTTLLERAHKQQQTTQLCASIVRAIARRSADILYHHDIHRRALQTTSETAVHGAVDAVELLLLPHDSVAQPSNKRDPALAPPPPQCWTAEKEPQSCAVDRYAPGMVQVKHRRINNHQELHSATTLAAPNAATAKLSARKHAARGAGGHRRRGSALSASAASPHATNHHHGTGSKTKATLGRALHGFQTRSRPESANSSIFSGNGSVYNGDVLSPSLQQQHHQQRSNSGGSSRQRQRHRMHTDTASSVGTAVSQHAAPTAPMPFSKPQTEAALARAKFREEELRRLDRNRRERIRNDRAAKRKVAELARQRQVLEDIQGNNYTRDDHGNIIIVHPQHAMSMPVFSHAPQVQVVNAGVVDEVAARLKRDRKAAALKERKMKKEREQNEQRHPVPPAGDKASTRQSGRGRGGGGARRAGALDPFVDTSVVQPAVVSKMQLEPGVTVRQGNVLKTFPGPAASLPLLPPQQAEQRIEQLARSKAAAQDLLGLTRRQFRNLASIRKKQGGGVAGGVPAGPPPHVQSTFSYGSSFQPRAKVTDEEILASLPKAVATHAKGKKLASDSEIKSQGDKTAADDHGVGALSDESVATTKQKNRKSKKNNSNGLSSTSGVTHSRYNGGSYHSGLAVSGASSPTGVRTARQQRHHAAGATGGDTLKMGSSARVIRIGDPALVTSEAMQGRKKRRESHLVVAPVDPTFGSVGVAVSSHVDELVHRNQREELTRNRNDAFNEEIIQDRTWGLSTSAGAASGNGNHSGGSWMVAAKPTVKDRAAAVGHGTHMARERWRFADRSTQNQSSQRKHLPPPLYPSSAGHGFQPFFGTSPLLSGLYNVVPPGGPPREGDAQSAGAEGRGGDQISLGGHRQRLKTAGASVIRPTALAQTFFPLS